MRDHHHGEFPPERLARDRAHTVSVVVPAREEAATIGAIASTCASLRGRGVIDELLVVDAGSRDGTPEIAARAGAEVRDEAQLLPEFGPVLGKGDAMWRALSVARGELIVYVDGDTRDFGEHFVCGLLGPLLLDPGVEFVKAFYRRPFVLGNEKAAEGGGRVNELTARPLLSAFYPELADVRQPLAGEVAARRELLERLPFATGYAVEVAMLLDAWSAAGVGALAQVDLDVRQNRHQPLGDLRPMADAVLAAVAARLARDGRLGGRRPTEPVERPPLASL